MADLLCAESVAYHEAGHTVVAAALGLGLNRYGIKVDDVGNGISYYEKRKPESLRGVDTRGEHTVISIFAGLIAQRKFHAGCSDKYASRDREHIDKLLSDMYIPKSFQGPEAFDSSCELLESAKVKLRTEPKRLVDEHWMAIRDLANALWGRSPTPRESDEPDKCWSQSLVERTIDGAGIVAILQTHGISASIVDDSSL